MSDADLSDSETLDHQEGGQKPMHSVPKAQPLHAWAAKHLKRTPRISNRLSQNPVSNGIGKPGNEPARKRITTPNPIAHQCIQGSQSLKHHQHIGGIGLQVGVHGNDQIATSGSESSIQG